MIGWQAGGPAAMALWLALASPASPGAPPPGASPPDAPHAGAGAAPPSVPASLTAVARSGNRVEIRWEASSSEAGVAFYNVYRRAERIASPTETAATDTGLSTGAEPCYFVVAVDRAGERSLPAGPACVKIPDTTPPAVPARLVAEAPGEHEVTLGWEAPADDVGVDRYEVVRGGAIVATVSEPRAVERGLAVATEYCYVVRACDGAGNCSAPSRKACVVTPDRTAPSRPMGVAAKAAAKGGIELSWSEAADNVGVVGYEVYRGSALAERLGTDTTWTDRAPRPTAESCYHVRALDAAGNRSPPSAPACAIMPDAEPPTVPGRLAVAPVSASQVSIGWEPSTDDVGVVAYEVYRDGVLIVRGAGTRAREANLQAQREYCYTVRAVDAAGNRSEAQAPACATTGDGTRPPAPTNLSVRRLPAGNVLLQWDASAQAGVTYRIYADGGRSVGLTTNRTFDLRGNLLAGYSCFRVVAVDAGGRESPKTLEECAEGQVAGSR